MDHLRSLSSWLDQPGFPWKSLIITFGIGEYVFENFLAYRQYQVLKRTVVPKQLKNEIDQETFDKSQAYGRDKARFGFITGFIDQVKGIAVYQYDVYPRFWAMAGLWTAQYLPAWFQGTIAQSLIFVFGLMFIETILGMPKSYYYNFVLEQKWGFNKQSMGLWLTDMLKSQALSLAFGIPLGWAFLKIIDTTGDSFFMYLWAFTFLVSLLAVTIVPIYIMPLFNKFTPLEPGKLKDAVEALSKRLKFPLSELYVVDGSKRSSHSNAYFTGLPWKKRIVLFDVLLKESTDDEVEAVLGHELGHWSMSHTTKLLCISQAHVFFIFVMFAVFLRNGSLYESFGFVREQPTIIGFLLFSEVLTPTEAVISFLMNQLTRRYEFEADKFAVDLGYAKNLGQALIKLQIQNLSSMDADALYSSFHHSHPILTERLKAMNWTSSEKVVKKPVKKGGSGAGVTEEPTDKSEL